jgi:hypothetical protein
VLKTLLPIDNDAMMRVMILTDGEFHAFYDASNDNTAKHTM